jgi:hypothetical protein
VAEQKVLGGDDGARGEEAQERSDAVAKEVDHGAILGWLVSRSSRVAPVCPPKAFASRFCGSQVLAVVNE